ncbi:MAG: hypothetical protein ACXVA7_15045 [Isosphaeraceae bacterium]
MKTTILRSLICFSLTLVSMSGQQPPDGAAEARARLVDPLFLLKRRPAQLQSVSKAPSGSINAAAKAYNFITVDYPGAARSIVYGSNGKTDVGGFLFDPSSPPSQPLVHTATKYTTLLIPESTYAAVTGINSAGTMCGVYGDTSGRVLGFTYNGVVTPFAISGSVSTTIRGINDAGDLVGDYVESSGVQHGFVDIGGLITSIDYPGGINTTFTSINNFGQAVGFWQDSGYFQHGFVWSNGTFTSLDFPGSLATDQRGINDAGKIVGDTFDATTSHGFLYDGTFKTIDIVGAKFTFPTHIDNQNRITGFYLDALDEYHGFKGH